MSENLMDHLCQRRMVQTLPGLGRRPDARLPRKARPRSSGCSSSLLGVSRGVEGGERQREKPRL